MGKNLALVDRTPGLTRDRREAILQPDLSSPQNTVFDIPIRLVDTAGFEGTKDLDPVRLSHRNLNRKLIEEMLR